MSKISVEQFLPALRFSAGVALEFLTTTNRYPAFDKDKYLELMLGVVVKPEQNTGYAELIIATTLSRNCTKPIVVSSFIYFAVIEFGIIILKSFVS